MTNQSGPDLVVDENLWAELARRYGEDSAQAGTLAVLIHQPRDPRPYAFQTAKRHRLDDRPHRQIKDRTSIQRSDSLYQEYCSPRNLDPLTWTIARQQLRAIHEWNPAALARLDEREGGARQHILSKNCRHYLKAH